MNEIHERYTGAITPEEVDEKVLEGSNGFKNLIINGCLRVNQRGTVSIDETPNAYNFDRWYFDGANFIQYIEDKNIVLNGTYTLSWVGTATAIVDGNAVVNGGQVTLAANTQCEVKFNSSDFSFAQLEFGNKKTNFEIRPYGMEFALCQRYFEVTYNCYDGHSSSAGKQMQYTKFVFKRVIPSVVINVIYTSQAFGTDTYMDFITQNGARTSVTQLIANKSGNYYIKIIADAEIYPL